MIKFQLIILGISTFIISSLMPSPQAAIAEVNKNSTEILDSPAALVKNSQYEDAIKELDSIILNDPSNAGAYLIRARAYNCKGEYQEALEDYTEASILKSDLEEIYPERISCCGYLIASYGAGRVISFGKPDKWYRVRQNIPARLQGLSSNMNDLRAKLKGLESTIEPIPCIPQTKHEPLSASIKGPIEKIQDELLDSVGLEHWYSPIYNCAINADKTGQHQKATKYILMGLGLLEQIYNRDNTAVEHYNKIISLDSKSYAAHICRAIAYERLNEHSKSIDDYSNALENYPNAKMQNSYIYLNRGLAYGELGQYDKSIADYNQAIKDGLKSGAVYYYRGEAYSKLGNAKAADADQKRAAKLGYPA